MIGINDTVACLKGVGAKRAEAYRKLGVDTIGSLVQLFPRKYIDYTHTTPLVDCNLGEICLFEATVTQKKGEIRIRRGLSIFRVVATDGEREVKITIFNSRYQYDCLVVGNTYYFRGKLQGKLLLLELASPDFVEVGAINQIKAVYPLTEGLSQNMVAQTMKQALEYLNDSDDDLLPDEIKQHESLCQLQFAYQNIHFPQDQTTLAIAKKRLVFDEFLALQLALGLLKFTHREKTGIVINDRDLTAFYEQLPFRLTAGQQQAIDQALGDFLQTVPMNRLLQGDVGCGKTMVACALAFCMAKNGYQTAIMAPTELLGRQHAATFEAILAPMGISSVLLVGTLTPKQKKDIKQQIATMQCDIVIGTHALIQNTVVFGKLGLVVTDEQHRFGVEQRARLAKKGENPHCFIMSATPIPRTLALMIYGDLELSIIKDAPKGRLPTNTYLIHPDQRQRAFAFMKQQIVKGYQGYIVCPLIDEGDGTSDLESIEEYAKNLQSTTLGCVQIGILHGKMKADEKQQVMQHFRAGQLALLLATTVVEVGVDVPNAVVMMIENAERFGLSQLHQLRGRVGRGAVQSHCILLSASKNEKTRERLQIMTASTDGFYIAEQDLKQRGAGDFFGKRQHGLPDLKLANMIEDIDTLQATGYWTKKILTKDPTLTTPQYAGLRKLVDALMSGAMHQA